MKMNCKETKKRWTAEEAEYIQQNLGKVSLEKMAAYLNRSSMSVRLYVLRKRISPKTAIKRNILTQMLKTKFRHPEDFSPTRAFYQETNINQRRWWDLYYGRKSITAKEYAAIADYLGLTIQEAFESRQLTFFEENEE